MNMLKKIRVQICILLTFTVCSITPVCAKTVSASIKSYGFLTDGREVHQYELKNENITVKIINYGGIITDIIVPDNKGNTENVVLGYDNLLSYETKNRFFGAIVGRYANRIYNAETRIDEQLVKLSKNKEQHHIHGGHKGFDKVLWQGELVSGLGYSRLILRYFSANGEEGYPGNLFVTVTYTLLKNQRLKVDYFAETDAPTVVNLTQHSYFNLQPSSRENVVSHLLKLPSSHYLPLDSEGFPQNEPISVVGTPFNFTKFRSLESALIQEHPQLQLAKGIDHYWIRPISAKVSDLSELATLKDTYSGRELTVFSTARGLQVYTANYLNETVIGRNDQAYKIHQGICLETGEYPNAPANADFPSALITPNNPFRSTTVFQFSNDG